MKTKKESVVFIDREKGLKESLGAFTLSTNLKANVTKSYMILETY